MRGAEGGEEQLLLVFGPDPALLLVSTGVRDGLGAALHVALPDAVGYSIPQGHHHAQVPRPEAQSEKNEDVQRATGSHGTQINKYCKYILQNTTGIVCILNSIFSGSWKKNKRDKNLHDSSN